MITADKVDCLTLPNMELARNTAQHAKYSPTSTPVLDVLRPFDPRGYGRISSGDYFFLSSTVILALIAVPWLRAAAVSISSVPTWRAIAVAVLIIPAGALAAAIAVHEAGHLLAAWLAGFRFAASAESMAARELYGVQGFQLGILKLEMPETDQLPPRLLWVMIGGPAASFAAPLILEGIAAQAQPRAVYALGIHALSALSALLGVAELLPDAGKGIFSDGARILMLLRNDAAGRRWLCNLRLVRALVRGQHPRSWEDVLSATAIRDDTRDAATAHWLGYLWAVELQNITLATKFLEDALAAPQWAAAGLRNRLCLEAAVFQAWFREDFIKARFWTEQIGRGKLSQVQEARLEVARLWAEGKLFDSWEKLENYFTTLREMPSSPAQALMEKSALEWKTQLESRMLTRAWRAMYAHVPEQARAALQNTR